MVGLTSASRSTSISPLTKMAARGITLNQLSALLSRLNVVSSAGEITSGNGIHSPASNR